MAKINLNVNGQSQTVDVDPSTPVLWVLRDHLNLVGTKFGCGMAMCGACTIHLDGNATRSCILPVSMAVGKEITTIEGLGTPDAMHPMQASFLACDAYQCGYCTSGQIMSAVALLKEPCGPDDASVKELMSGNICRCGAYANIVEAIQHVRKRA